MRIYKYDRPYALESGAVLPEIDIAYHTFGRLSAKGDNIIWVCHALTANSDVKDWWQGAVEKGQFLDPDKYFIICANILGSCYGTTGPLSVNPMTKKPYYSAFPRFTVRDVVNVHRLLAAHLQIKSVKMLIGSSIGGFQVSEWLIMDPKFTKKGVIIASATHADAWVIAFNESQRMAIEADSTYGDQDTAAGQKGLATARSIALLSYRGRKAYVKTQSEHESDDYKITDHRAASYQRYQGKKLVDRFNAYSYYRLTELIDSHNIARARVSVEKALSNIKAEVVLVAITSDLIYPITAQMDFHKYIKNSTLNIIESEFGHDGFLIEHEKLNEIVTKFLDN